MTPSSGIIMETNTLTLNCENGWQFADSTTNKVFTCNGLNTYNPVMEYCTGDKYSIIIAIF